MTAFKVWLKDYRAETETTIHCQSSESAAETFVTRDLAPGYDEDGEVFRVCVAMTEMRRDRLVSINDAEQFDVTLSWEPTAAAKRIRK